MSSPVVPGVVVVTFTGAGAISTTWTTTGT